MKFRDDFVTNSSSSSFIVRIEVKTTDGSMSVFTANGGAAYDGNGQPNLFCSPEQLAASENLEILTARLTADYADISGKRLKEFTDNLCAQTGSLENIQSITLRRIWTPWGEGSGCTVVNDEQLQTLAAALASAKGKAAKEAAKAAFVKYLEEAEVSSYGGWSDSWPTGFCGASDVKGKYYWAHLSDNVEKLAKNIASGKISNDDLAEEITFIDMGGKEVVQSARFIIDSDAKVVEPDYERSLLYFKQIIQAEFSDFEITENADVHAFAPDADALCTPLSLLISREGKPLLGICIVSRAESNAKGIKLTKAACAAAELEYLRFLTNEENPASKVLSKIRSLLYKDLFSLERLEGLPSESQPFTMVSLFDTGTKYNVKIKFRDNRTYSYYCCAPVKPGDLAMVQGQYFGQPGIVIEASPTESPVGYAVTALRRS